MYNRKFSSKSQLLQYFLINGFSTTGESKVEDAIWRLYSASDTLAAAIDLVYDPAVPPTTSGQFFIDFVAGAAITTLQFQQPSISHPDFTTNENYRSPSIATKIEIDSDHEQQVWFFRENGTIAQYSFDRILGHELYHAFEKYFDPVANRKDTLPQFTSQMALDHLADDPSSELAGKVVEGENQISLALGESADDKRISYFNSVKPADVSTTVSRTDGDIVEHILLVGNFSEAGAGLSVNLHNRTGDALILGYKADDKIVGAGGDDYLYGLGGSDTFYGNDGFDFLHGGELVGDFGGEKPGDEDVVDYRLWNSYDSSDANAINTTSITVKLDDLGNSSAFGATTDEYPIYVDDGHGGVDRLVSIEKIFGTNQNDVLQIRALIDQQAQPDLVIDFGRGKDIVDISLTAPADGGHTVDLSDLSWQQVYLSSGGGPILSIRNADDIEGGDTGDNLYTPNVGDPSTDNYVEVKDPIVLDLDGDGIELLPYSVFSPFFNIDGGSLKEQVGWVKGDDGLLARDLNANGAIDDISELFGNNDEDGFEVLASFDTNTDGVIDSNDAIFADLRVWQDADQDAETDSGELKTLAELGIVSFSLTTSDPTVSEIAGNEITVVADYTLSGGATRTAANVAFTVNNGATITDPNGDPNDPNDPDDPNNNPGGEGEDADRAFVSIAAGNGGDDTFFPGLANALLDGGEGDDTFEIRYERTDLVDEAIADGFQNVSTATLDKQMASLIGGVGEDIARYTQADTGTQLALSFNPVVDQLAQDRLTGGTFFKLESDDTENLFAEIEIVELSAESDELTVEEALAQKIGDGSTIDGGNAASQGTINATLADKLDFSTSTGPVYIKDADDGSAATEVFANYDPVTVSGLRVFNVFIPAGDPKGDGLTDPTGLMFANFEYVKGSAHDDVLGLWKLSPSGELSASDRQLFDNLKSSPLGTLGNPIALATETDARVAAAAVITQNQQEVIIEGGAGRDIILGTETGINKIYGGEGVDHVVAGGYVSEVYGGEGVDFVQGGGTFS